MKKMMWLVGFAAATLAARAVARATSYSGSLSAPGGLEVGGSGAAWTGSPAPGLTWTVTETSPGTWHYRYTLTAPSNAVERIILEASDGSPGPAFKSGDLQSAALSWPAAGDISIGYHAVAPENPGMPADMWGIQLDMTFPVMTVLGVAIVGRRRLRQL